MTTNKLSENIDFEVIKNAEGFKSLIKLREVNPTNDGNIFLTVKELSDLYHKVFNVRNITRKNIDNQPDVDLYDPVNSNSLYEY